MDLFEDIQKGKFGKNKSLKKEAKHELGELGGMKTTEKFEKMVKREQGIAGGKRDKSIGKIISNGNVLDQKKSMAKKMPKEKGSYKCDEGHTHRGMNKNGDYCPDNIPF
jgi:hypothetical protein